MSARVLTFPTTPARPPHGPQDEPEEPSGLFYVVRESDGACIGRTTIDGPLTFTPPAFAYAYDYDHATALQQRHPGTRLEAV